MSWKEQHICCANTIHAEIQNTAEKGSEAELCFQIPAPKPLQSLKRKERVSQKENEKEWWREKEKETCLEKNIHILWLFHSAQDRETISVVLKGTSIDWNTPGHTKDPE